jgi:hypothetical protein
MTQQQLDTDKRAKQYESAVAMIVDQHLRRLDEELFVSVRDQTDLTYDEKQANYVDGLKEVVVFMHIHTSAFQGRIRDKAQELEQRAPNEDEWKAISEYFAISGAKVKLKIVGNKDWLVVGGTSTAGIIAGSVVPVVGNALGAVIGASLGFWRMGGKDKKNKQENEVALNGVKQKAIQQVKDQRQYIIDAILASNY